jgi:hypothetical protein
MATPADQRLTELLDRWLTSLGLHLKYSSLDDDTYWKIQPWVEHQRPTRWIVDLARQKTAALKAQVEERVKAGDTRFSDALEQMMFLANLVGLQHIERFIPVAEPERERGRGEDDADSTATTSTRDMPGPSTSATGTREMPRPSTSATGTREMPRPSTATTGTREMPRPPVRAEKKKAAAKAPAKSRREPAAPAPVRTAPARAAPARAAPARTASVPTLPVPPPPGAEATRKQVIDDAVRLLQWGRRWFELAELIARMADRPPVRVVSKLLNENRTSIEKAMTESKSGK